ncbi:MAG TPA: MFS transporter, partial [Candidatus Wallbacteria bacterium]|nr:MFS transporter [Candidatus Wallbacteria bacterium]
MDEKKTVLIIAMLSAFITPFNGSSVNIALPAIKEEFSASVGMLGWVAMSYLLTSAIFLIPFGRLGDIYGRKKIFVSGISIFTLASVLALTCTSINQLIVFRVFQGIGSSMVFGTSMAILTSVYPLNERGKAFGMSVASTYTGLSAGPFIGGVLTQYLGWRSVFAVVAILGVPAIVLAVFKLKGEFADARNEKFDLAGSILYCLMFSVLMYGLSILPEKNGIILMAIGTLLFAAFIKFEIASESPIFNVSLFMNNRVFAFSNIAALIHYSATFGITFILSLYLQYVKGMDPHHTGLILISQPIVMALFSPLAGRLSDRVEPRFLSSLGMGLTAAGLFSFVFLSETTSLFMIVVTLLFIGFGYSLFSTPNTNAVMSSVEKKFYGVASSTLST